MIKAGIIGATGYAGNELVRLLMGHKEVEIKWYGSRSYIDQKYAEVYQNMFEIVDDVCMDDNMEALAEQVDVIFTATPQGFLAGVLNEGLLEKTKIIDLSADFRITDHFQHHILIRLALQTIIQIENKPGIRCFREGIAMNSGTFGCAQFCFDLITV